MRYLKLNMFVLTLLVPATLLAEIAVVHNPETVTLPPSGAETTITFALSGTRTDELPVEVEMIRDGKVSHLLLDSGKINTNNQPVYTMKVAAPTAGLHYRMKVIDDEGDEWLSPYYTVFQECQHESSATALKAEEPDDIVSQAGHYLERAKIFERRLNAYDHAVSRLTELRSMFEDQ